MFNATMTGGPESPCLRMLRCFLVSAAKWFGGIDQVDEQVALFERRAHRVHHALVDGAVGFVNARRIDENDLSFGRGENALNRRACGLRLIGDDGDLLAYQSVQQSRFAGVGTS